MENFFRPRQMNSHTSLVSKLLSPNTRKEPLLLHDWLHEQAEEKERNKSIREHVSSKTHIKRLCMHDSVLFDEHRQRRREHWETHYNKHWKSAPKINYNSRMLSAGSSLKGFNGERTHFVNLDPLTNGVYRKSLADTRPIFELDVRPIEARYRMSLQSQGKSYQPNLSQDKSYQLNLSQDKSYQPNLSQDKSYQPNLSQDKSYQSNRRADLLASVDSNQSDTKDKNELRQRTRVKQPIFNLGSGSKFELVK